MIPMEGTEHHFGATSGGPLFSQPLRFAADCHSVGVVVLLIPNYTEKLEKKGKMHWAQISPALRDGDFGGIVLSSDRDCPVEANIRLFLIILEAKTQYYSMAGRQDVSNSTTNFPG